MLHGLRLIDIGNHKDTTLRLGPVTAILGPNGSGKTTVLKAIEWIGRATPQRDLPPPVNEWHELGQIVRSGTEAGESIVQATFREGSASGSLVYVLSCDIWQDFDSLNNATQASFEPAWMLHKGADYKAWIQPDPWDHVVWSKPQLDTAERNWRGIGIRDMVERLPDGDHRIPPSAFRDLPRFIGAVRSLRLNPAELKMPSYSTAVIPEMQANGGHLASVLSDLMTTDHERFIAIVDAVRSVIPFVKNIRAARCPLTIREPRSVAINKKDVPYLEDREVIGQQLRFDMTSGENLPAESISDGTLIVLAITTLLMTTSARMILLDDIEHGLHPSAQRQVIQLIKTLQKKYPSTQIVFTTHSPYVVDEMDPAHVWVMGLDKEGCAHAKALSEHPKAAKAMEVLTAGEFWSAEGEDWVVPETTEA